MAKSTGRAAKKSTRNSNRTPTKGPTSADFAHPTTPISRVPADALSQPDAGLSTIVVGSRIFSGKARKIGGRKLDILPDMPDIRDRIYTPHLRALHPAIYPRIAFSVRDQGQDSSCTGFSLAHVVDFLRFREVGPDSPTRVSPRMLYEMAKRNDEWSGSNYEGSSVRGAIKGFFRNGVCSEVTAPDLSKDLKWTLTYEMAKEARETRLGVYFRLQPDITDYHAALNDLGVIYASAQIHSGWETPDRATGFIKPGGKPWGGHAFAIVGYDDTGFWVLNSWGAKWGKDGLAHWQYEDWASNVMDSWVLQLGVRAPSAFGATPRVSLASSTRAEAPSPNRADIIGHFINIDDGVLIRDGKYGSPTDEEMQETVKRLARPDANKGKGYEHLVIYCHGGLNDLADEARRIATWKRHDIFGRNKLYNFHLMWGSGFIDEVFGKMSKAPAAAGGGGILDWLFEAGPGKEIGAYAWRNMKQDATAAFDGSQAYDGGFAGLAPLLSGLDKSERRPKIHLVGHSAGSIVLGNFLSSLKRFKIKNLELSSIHLMAPACTVDFFKTHYTPYLKGEGALKLADKMYLYNLPDEWELEDKVKSDLPLVPSYSHSLLYLVSRAFENPAQTPIAGMQRYRAGLPLDSRKLDVSYAKAGGASESKTHGGFDNDAATINTIMRRILGEKVPFPPKSDELTGY